MRKGEAPAAELILLPDGGELKPEKIEPVLQAFERKSGGREQRQVEDLRRRCQDLAGRHSASPRSRFQKEIPVAYEHVGTILGELPLRPSMIDDVVAELSETDRAVRGDRQAGVAVRGPHRGATRARNEGRVVGAALPGH